MSRDISLDLEILTHYIEEQCGGKEYFLGCWSADDFDVNLNADPANIQIERGNNWVVLRNGADRCKGLLFPNNESDEVGSDLVVFRGYLAEAGIHSYSPSTHVRKYWTQEPNRRHNGIFSAVTISECGDKLSLVTDIFGMGALYYRQVGNKILFSSCSGLLALHDDQADTCSWMLNVVLGFIPGNETMTKGILQPDTASITSFTRDGMSKETWYDPKSFPTGDGVVDEDIYDLSQ